MLKFLPQSRILLVRTDHIGDVLLTTPAAASLRRKYPKAFIGFLCSSYTAPLLMNNPNVNQVIMIDDSFPFGVISRIKELKFDASVHFFVEPKSMFAAYAAKIPRRIGPLSKAWSFMLTDKIVQNRSSCEKHEAEYNLDLAKECGADGMTFPPNVFLNSFETREGAQMIQMAIKVPDTKPIVFHPGSHGSAERWPLDHFLDLAVRVADRGDHVLFTGGKGEEKIIAAAQKLKHKNVNAVAAGSLSLRHLAAVIANSKLFVGNSSGPLHIATALAVPTISFFPKTPLVTSARRWGPFGSTKLNRVLVPARDGLSLSSITPDLALEWVINVFQSKENPDSDDVMIG